MSEITTRPLARKLAGVLMAAALWAIPVPGTASPNILLIVADDLGYGDLSSYGSTDLQTPHIDRLMQRGIRFDRFYANCPVCSPTRASLLTGRYPEMVGVPGVIRTHAENSWGALDPRAVLLPQMLKQAGYDTALVGKWHLGLQQPDWPTRRGFDFFQGFLGDMMDDYYHHRRHGVNYMRLGEHVIEPEGHATGLFTQWSIEYLRSRRASQNPFLLALTYNAPHTPIQPPAEWLDRIARRQPDADPARQKLVALIEHMDHGIGQVLAALDELKLSENTLVIFTSDNGGQLNVGANNGNLRDGKQSMYEGGLLVPTCFVWPKKIAAGRRSNAMAISMDLFPTLCDVAAVPVSHEIDGRTLWPILSGQKESLRDRDLFFVRREGGLRYNGLEIRALRRGPWKLVQNSPYQPWELYHLDDDPQESTNLAESHSDVYREMCAAMRRQIQRGGRVPWQAAGE